MNILIDPHPLLDPVVIHTVWPCALSDMPPLAGLDRWFSDSAAPPMDRPDTIKPTIRDLLRHGGFKPSGRSKPASEYLVSAAANGKMGSINAAVDCCNVASLHSGVPISVVDLERGCGPWRLGLAPPETSYVFNPSGQEINISGLISLWDSAGPCGGPVKDSQRTKTHPGTTTTLSIIWGSLAIDGRSTATAHWYSALMSSLGAIATPLRPAAPSDHRG